MRGQGPWLVCAAIVVAAVAGLPGQAPPAKKAYILVQSNVTNPDQYAKYAAVSPGIVAKYGGRFLARGGRSTTLEGPKAPARVVVIEFPSYEAAERFYHSSDYTAARAIRASAATMQFVLVEGL
jgi:uncharacterized protein (DUF1330 family)